MCESMAFKGSDLLGWATHDVFRTTTSLLDAAVIVASEISLHDDSWKRRTWKTTVTRNSRLL